MGLLHFTLQILIGAVIGYFINFLFSRWILNKLAANKPALANMIADEAAQWMQSESIADKLKDPKNLEKVKPVIEQHVDTFLKVKLQEKMPAIAMFVGGSTLDKLKDGLLEEIDMLLPEVLAGYAENMGTSMNISHLVRQKINEIPAELFKDKLGSGLKKEIRSFRLLGAVAGIIIAILQLAFSLGGIWFAVMMSE